MALEPTQPPLQWVRGILSQNVKRPDYEFEHLPISSAKVTPCRAQGIIYLHIFFLSNE